jgi:hypothetical protein
MGMQGGWLFGHILGHMVPCLALGKGPRTCLCSQVGLVVHPLDPKVCADKTMLI